MVFDADRSAPRRWPLLLVVTILACAHAPVAPQRYSTIAFRFTSLSHLQPKESFVTVELPPERVGRMIREQFVSAGGSILTFKESNERVSISERGEECWAIFRRNELELWRIYEQNDFVAGEARWKELRKAYVDAGFSSGDCFFTEGARDPAVQGWLVKAEFPGHRKGEAHFTSRIGAWVFRLPGESRTQVYMKGWPVERGVEACDSCSIGHDHWRDVTAEREADLVRRHLKQLVSVAALETGSGQERVVALVSKEPARKSSPSVRSASGEKIVLLPLEAGEDVSAKVAALLSDLLVTDIQQKTGYQVITSKDVAALLALDREKAKVDVEIAQRMGEAVCTADTSCLAEIGGALGAPLVVTGSISRVGSTFVITTQLLDSRRAAVLSRAHVTSSTGGEESLIQKVPELTAGLFPSR